MDAQEPGETLATHANAIQMARAVQQTHYQLSQMADHKASFLMGADFLIFTFIIGQAKGAEIVPVPLLVLGVFAFASAVLAILAVLPVATTKPGAPLNLLFFGSFVQFDQAEYTRRMLAAVETNEGIYKVLVNDIYQNGRVLAGKKYRLLGYAYRVFLAGLVVSLATFVVAFFVR